jgi:hypothetical protein
MIEPTEADIGRRVTYAADGGATRGTLSSFTDHYAFVTWDVTLVEFVQVQKPRKADPQRPNEDPGYDIGHKRKETVVTGRTPSATSFNDLEWAQ